MLIDVRRHTALNVSHAVLWAGVPDWTQRRRLCLCSLTVEAMGVTDPLPVVLPSPPRLKSQ